MRAQTASSRLVTESALVAVFVAQSVATRWISALSGQPARAVPEPKASAAAAARMSVRMLFPPPNSVLRAGSVRA